MSYIKDWVAKMDACEDMADVCELSHKRTVRECRELKIKVDCVGVACFHPDRLGETHYTDKAQEIFDTYYDEITNHTGL